MMNIYENKASFRINTDTEGSDDGGFCLHFKTKNNFIEN